MRYSYLILLLFFMCCRPAPNETYNTATAHLAVDSTYIAPIRDTVLPIRMVAFAKTLIGTRYVFGCSAPSTGFDCSGFINYIFDHFNITVPRSSVDFTDAGTTISLEKGRPGDLILFTGTNSNLRVVGHIGMIVSNNTDGISFIHASSGKENAVIITTLDDRYMKRFVKVVRITER